MIYIKNCIIILSKNNKKTIFFFKNINNVFANILNWQTLNYKVYIITILMTGRLY